MLLKRLDADSILESAPLSIRHVCDFGRHDHMFGNQTRSKTGAEAKKQHATAFVRSNRLHRRIIDELDLLCKTSGVIKVDPSLAEIARIMHRFIFDDGRWQAD